MNRKMMMGVILTLSIGSIFAADCMPENGFSIVPMPYEVKRMEGHPFVITKDTVLAGRA